MCTYIWTRHSDCSHKQYQNTFDCPEAKGSKLFQSYANLTLSHTVHLPASPPKQIPNPLCKGDIKNAVRPVPGLCRACIRHEREKKQQKLGKSDGPTSCASSRGDAKGAAGEGVEADDGQAPPRRPSTMPARLLAFAGAFSDWSSSWRRRSR